MLPRLRAFVDLVLAVDSGQSPLLVRVVRKLQAALASVETFPVLLSASVVGNSRGGGAGGPSGSGAAGRFSGVAGGGGGGAAAGAVGVGSYRQGLAALARPFKLRLARHGSERRLRDYSSNVVLIEPLATMHTIEEFLYSRVYQPGLEAGTASGAAARGSPPGGARRGWRPCP